MDLSERIDIAILPGSYNIKLFNFLIKLFVKSDKNTIYELIQYKKKTYSNWIVDSDRP